VIARQGDAVRALGCERVICLTERFGPEILALQRLVEGDGGEFHAVRSGLQLPALVRADDELVVLLDGLVADRAALEAAACESGELRRGVLAIPAGHPLAQAHPEAFERIDRERSWAGLIVMDAAPVQQLADLPGDAATISLLLRLALQAGTPLREVDAAALADGQWLLATSGQVLAAREQALVDRCLAETPWTGPGRALAQEAARRIAPRGLAAGPLVAAAISLVLLALGAVLAGLGFGAAGLALAAAGAFAGAWSDAAAQLAAGLLGEARRPFSRRVMNALVDGIAAATLALALLFGSSMASADPEVASLGLLAVGLARLAKGDAGSLARAFWGDRAGQLAALALASALGSLGPALALLALVALAQILLRTER
jgi:hypothetical protein